MHGENLKLIDVPQKKFLSLRDECILQHVSANTAIFR